MAKRVLRGAALSLKTGALLIILVVYAGAAACASDGGAEHGPDLSTLPELDGGRRQLPDGAILLPDGAVTADDDDDDASHDSGPPACTQGGTAAIVAGNTSTLTGAVKVKGSTWMSTSIQGGSAASKPSLVAFGTGFIGASQGGDASASLWTFGFDNSWSAAAAVGTPGVKGSPTLAVTGTTAHVVYSTGPGADTNYLHGTYDGTNWDGAADPVKGPKTTSFGTVSAGLASPDGTTLAFVEDGSDNGLYARVWSDSWMDSVPVQGAGTIGSNGMATPEVLPVTGTYDLIILYTDNTGNASGAPIAWATHTPGGTPEWGANAAPFEIDKTNAVTAQKMAAAALNDTTIVVSFVNTSGNAMYAVGTVGASGVTWTAPANVGGGSALAVDSVAAVAPGICGADAIFAYASGGAVMTTSLTLSSNSWSRAETVTGVSGKYVAVASQP